MKIQPKKLNFEKRTLKNLTTDQVAGVVGGLGGQTWGPIGTTGP